MDVVTLLAFLTLISNVFLSLFFFTYLVKLVGKNDRYYKAFTKFLNGRRRNLSFIIALTATLGSLYLSEVKGYTPCTFCWYQRILMYPLAFVLGAAVFKKAKDYQSYVLPMSIFGIFVSAYHYKLQISPNMLAPCTTVGFSVSCSERFFTYYNYITIPWMALSAFLLISVFTFLSLKSSKK